MKNQNSIKKESFTSFQPMRSAFFMSIALVISRSFGLVRDICLASFFSKTVTDAFFIAFRLPNLFRRIFGEDAISASFIPIFLKQKRNSLESAHQIKDSLFTLMNIFASVLTLLVIVFIEPIVGFLFSNLPFSDVSGKLELTLLLSRSLFAYFFLMMNYSYFLAISNACGRFFLPAIAPVFLNISLIVASFIPKDFLNIPALALVLACLIGGFLQAGLTFYQLYKLNHLPKFRIPNWSPALLSFFKKFLPASLSLGGFAIIGLLNLYFAAFLPEGSHTYIYYGDRLLELPKALIAVSLGVALLPKLSQLYNSGQKETFLRQSAEYRNLLLFLSLPSALGLYFLGAPLVEFLFLRGHFNLEDVHRVSQILKIYSFLLVFASVSRILNASFFATQNTLIPALATALSLICHASLAFYFTTTWGIQGLVTLSTISGFLYMSILLICYRKLLGSFYLKFHFMEFVKMFFALLLLSLYLYFASRILFFDSYVTGPLIFTVVSSIGLYFLIAYFLRMSSFHKFSDLFLKRLSSLKA